VNDVEPVLETDMLVGGFNSVVVETEFESTDRFAPLTDRIVIGEYVVNSLSPVTVTGLAVTPVFAETPFTYTV
jgi:hypothetical protein